MKRAVSLFAICFMLISGLSIPLVHAQKMEPSNFTVRAVIPDNQIDPKQTYFDLKMEPNKEQRLEVEIFNSGNEDMTVDVALHSASTNRNGVIEYLINHKPDDSLKTPFHTIAKADKEIFVQKNSSKILYVDIKMPPEAYEGVILGGIILTKREEGDPSAGVSVQNQFSYVVGVKLVESEKRLEREFELKSIEPTLVNYRKAVQANIQNPVALIVKNSSVSAQIYKADATDPLFSVNKNGVDMAPNSVMPFPIEWENQSLDPGNYRLALKLTNEGKVWQWDKAFTIDAAQSNEINAGAIAPSPSAPNWWESWRVIIPAILFGLILVFAAFLFGKRQRRKKVSEDPHQ